MRVNIPFKERHEVRRHCAQYPSSWVAWKCLSVTNPCSFYTRINMRGDIVRAGLTVNHPIRMKRKRKRKRDVVGWEGGSVY